MTKIFLTMVKTMVNNFILTVIVLLKSILAGPGRNSIVLSLKMWYLKVNFVVKTFTNATNQLLRQEMTLTQIHTSYFKDLTSLAQLKIVETIIIRKLYLNILIIV